MHHCAGLAGFGESSYIESVTLHDADEAGDSTLQPRTCTLQNWRADVAVAAKAGVGTETDGAFVCRGQAVDEACDKPTSDPLINADNGVDEMDDGDFSINFASEHPSSDLNRDAEWVSGDVALRKVAFSASVKGSMGLGVNTGMRHGYAAFAQSGYVPHCRVRYRLYHPQIGSFSKKNPIGNTGTLNVRNHVDSNPMTCASPFGLAPCFPCLQQDPYTVRQNGADPGTYFLWPGSVGAGTGNATRQTILRKLGISWPPDVLQGTAIFSGNQWSFQGQFSLEFIAGVSGGFQTTITPYHEVMLDFDTNSWKCSEGDQPLP